MKIKNSCPFTLKNTKRALWEVTHACNLNCIHCFVKFRDVNDDVDRVPTVFAILKSFGAKELWISGGEPLLAPKTLLKVQEYSEILGIPYTLSSNLTVNHKVLQQLDKVKYVHTSLDGPEKIHNIIRGYPNAFKKMIEGVKILKDMNIPVGASMVLSKLNSKIEIVKETIEIAEKLGLVKLSIYAPAKIGKAKDVSTPSREEYKRIFEFILKNYEEYPLTIEVIRFGPRFNFLDECLAENFITITPELKVGPCPWLVQSEPQIAEDPKENLVEQIKTIVERIKNTRQKQCYSCSYFKKVCLGGCLANAVGGRDPLCPLLATYQ